MSVQDVTKGFLDSQEKIRTLETQTEGALKPPGPDASDEERSKFYEAIGRPDAPEKYKLTAPTMPEGMPQDAERENWYRVTAHALGLSEGQAAGLFEQLTTREIELHQKNVEQQQQQRNEAIEEQKGRWGEMYDENVRRIRSAMQHFGSQDLLQKIERAGLGNDPGLLDCFLELGNMIQEDEYLTGEPVVETADQDILDTLYPTMRGIKRRD